MRWGMGVGEGEKLRQDFGTVQGNRKKQTNEGKRREDRTGKGKSRRKKKIA